MPCHRPASRLECRFRTLRRYIFELKNELVEFSPNLFLLPCSSRGGNRAFCSVISKDSICGILLSVSLRIAGGRAGDTRCRL
jgi:hypothetical protein